MSTPIANVTPALRTHAHETTDTIITSGVIAILRYTTSAHFPAITEALVRAGIRSIEVTLTTPGALACLRQLALDFDGAAVIGAGTVTDANLAEACIDAGARFLVSPASSPDVVAAARVADVAVFPGALTPTEVLAAHRNGASAVKLFPASVVSPRYIADLHAPLPDIALIPSGGIGLPDIEHWLDAGAAAVGLGGPLLGNAAEEGPDAALAERARLAVEAVRRARDS
jgi:2-dehydro-3-deoxyphosphogluconate aldolase/(4S)-4-hydroxy-2-oxoglutarate aldolase